METWEHTKGDLRGPGLDFYRFWKDFGAAIWTFLANFGTTIVFFGMPVCRSRFLKILGSESGCLGLQNQAFGVGGVAKSQLFTFVGILLISVSFSYVCSWLWDPILMTFGALETFLKFDDFRGNPSQPGGHSSRGRRIIKQLSLIHI